MCSSRQAGLALSSLLLFGSACGGRDRSPAAPTATPDLGVPAGTVLTVVSAENGEALPGARLLLGPRELIADGAGRVTLAERADLNTPVDVLATGFLDRQTVLRSRTPEPFALWPKNSPSGLDEHFSATLAYTGTAANAETGQAPLYRHAETTMRVYIVPAREILDDPDAMARQELGIAHVNTAMAGRLEYVLAEQAPAGAVRFGVTFNPADADCTGVRAYARWGLRGGVEITGGDIVFCVLDALYTSTVTHELGHTLGLRHSPYPFEIMGPTFSNRRPQEYSPREALLLQLMYSRRAGNRWPDNDRDARTLNVRASDTIVCR